MCAGMQVGGGGGMLGPLQLICSVGMNLNRRGVKKGGLEMHMREKRGVGGGGGCRESGLLALEALRWSLGCLRS